MPNYRQIHVSIWKDPWVLDLTPDEKLLFIYLFSNENASLAGIYELAIKVINFETGLDNASIIKALDKFAQAGKVFYDNELSIVWIRNLRKYNSSPSSKIQIRIEKDLLDIPDCDLKEGYIAYYNENIPYQYPIGMESLVMKCNDNEMKLKKGAKNNNAPPFNLDGWLSEIRESKNKSASLMTMFQTLYPQATESPDFGYIGRVANNVGGAGRLAALLWECSSKKITGDVMRYIQRYAKNNKREGIQEKQKDQPPAEEILKQLEDIKNE